jgi:hypothetical protein
MSMNKKILVNLSVFHYIFGALTAAFSFLHLISLGMGLFLLNNGSNSNVMILRAGWFLVIISAILLIVLTGLAVCIILTGVFLKQEKHYTFCMITAILECFLVPLGTVLGIFTLTVLNRNEIKQLF